MSAVEQLEQQVQSLSPAELSQFRAWFLRTDEQLTGLNRLLQIARRGSLTS